MAQSQAGPYFCGDAQRKELDTSCGVSSSMNILQAASCESSASLDSISALVKDSPPYSLTAADAESQNDTGQKGNIGRHFRGWRIILLGSWMNVLLLFIPISWVIDITMSEPSPAFIFALCVLSMAPLVKLHDLVTRDMAARIGGSKTGLMNASMNNSIEIVVALSALRKCELGVVQSSLIGSILAKLLLVLGISFVTGGLRFTEQDLDPAATQIQSSLLSLSVGTVVLPAAYHFALNGQIPDEFQKINILTMSHGVALVLLFVYMCYLVFQLYSHSHLFREKTQASKRMSYRLPAALATRAANLRKELWPRTAAPANNPGYPGSRNSSETTITCCADDLNDNKTGSSATTSISKCSIAHEPVTVRLVQMPTPPTLYRDFSSTSHSSEASDSSSMAETIVDPDHSYSSQSSNDGDHLNVPQISWTMTILLLVILAVTITFTADRIVESMDGISDTINKEWIALIVLPVVSSIAECITAANMSRRDQMTLSISVAVGSSIQTALFSIPFLIVLGWVMGKGLPLLFDPFQSLVLYISVNILSFVVANAKSHWLEGVMLISLYIIIAISFWFYPGSSLIASLSLCQ